MVDEEGRIGIADILAESRFQARGTGRSRLKNLRVLSINEVEVSRALRQLR